MNYPYSDGDNLQTPQKYMYTKYEGETFWKSYFNSREMVLESLKPDGPQASPIALDEEVKNNDHYNTHVILSECFKGNGEVKSQFLERLLQRFEVSKRFYDIYTLSFRSKIGNFQTEELYLLGYSLFLSEFFKTQDLRYLNVSLKLGDTLVSMFKNRMISGKYFEFFKKEISREIEIVSELRSANVHTK